MKNKRLIVVSLLAFFAVLVSGITARLQSLDRLAKFAGESLVDSSITDNGSLISTALPVRTGHIGINVNPFANRGFYYVETVSPTTNLFYGSHIVVTMIPTQSTSILGDAVYATISGSQNLPWYNYGGYYVVHFKDYTGNMSSTAIGVEGNVRTSGIGGGSLTELDAVDASINADALNTTIHYAIGVRIRTPSGSAASGIINAYGLMIDDQSGVGTNLDYNIYSIGANSKNRFEGSLEVDGTLLTKEGVRLYSPGTPTVSSNASLDGGSKDSAGKLNITSGSGSVLVTFSEPFSRSPACSVQNETQAVLLRPVSTTNSLTIYGMLNAGDKLSYQCLGY